MAETTIVATVARVEGRAFARSTDGKLRALQEGDALREGEVVVTESGARVELVATGGGRIDLPAGGEVRITADLDEATRADAAAASVEEATVASVLEYPLHDWTATVTLCGRICFKKRKVNLSQVFAGQRRGEELRRQADAQPGQRLR